MPAPRPDYIYLIGDVDGDNEITQSDLDALLLAASGGPLPAGMPMCQAATGSSFNQSNHDYLAQVAAGTAEKTFVSWLRTNTQMLEAPNHLFFLDGAKWSFVLRAEAACVYVMRLVEAKDSLLSVSLLNCSSVPGRPLEGASSVSTISAFGQPQGIGEFGLDQLDDVFVQLQIPHAGFYVVEIDGFDPRFGSMLWQMVSAIDTSDIVADMQNDEVVQKVIRQGTTFVTLPVDSNAGFEFQFALSPFYQGFQSASAGSGPVISQDLSIEPSPHISIPKGEAQTSPLREYVSPFQIVGTLPAGPQTLPLPSVDERTFLIIPVNNPLERMTRFFRETEVVSSMKVYTEIERPEFTEMSRLLSALTPSINKWNEISSMDDEFTVVVYRESASDFLVTIDLPDLQTSEKIVYVNAAVLEKIPDAEISGNLMPAFIAASFLWRWFELQTTIDPVIPYSFAKALGFILCHPEALDLGTPTLYIFELDYGGALVFHPWLQNMTSRIGALTVQLEAYYTFAQAVFSSALPMDEIDVPTMLAQVALLPDAVIRDIAVQLKNLAAIWGVMLPDVPTDDLLLRDYIDTNFSAFYPVMTADAQAAAQAITNQKVRLGSPTYFGPFSEEFVGGSLQDLFVNYLWMQQVLHLFKFNRFFYAWTKRNPVAMFASLVRGDLVNVLKGIHNMLCVVGLPLSSQTQLLNNYSLFRARAIRASSIQPDLLTVFMQDWPILDNYRSVPSSVVSVNSRTVQLFNVTTALPAKAGSVWMAKAVVSSTPLTVTITVDCEALLTVVRKPYPV